MCFASRRAAHDVVGWGDPFRSAIEIVITSTARGRQSAQVLDPLNQLLVGSSSISTSDAAAVSNAAVAVAIGEAAWQHLQGRWQLLLQQ